MSKAAVRTLIIEDPDLISLGVTPANVLRSSATESPEARPFIILAWNGETPAFKAVGTEGLQVWVYDEPGDYDRIDLIIDRIKYLITNAVEVEGLDGNTLSQALSNGSSADLYDDLFKCITRYADFTVLSRRS